VPTGLPHARSVDALFLTGVTHVCDADRFCPDRFVIRAQMASFLAAAVGLPAAGTAGFTDVSAGSQHAGSIGAVAAAGITSGCT